VKSSRLLLVVLLLISTSRIIPSIINNAVFSTDSWPLIRLTQLLIENSWIRVLSLNIHHAKYPLAVLFSLIYTEVTSLDVYAFYAFLGAPLVVLVLTILLYTLLSKYFEKLPSILALLALLLYSPFAVFTSAYLKEVYAYPLALILLYLVVSTVRGLKWIGVFIVALALVLSHPLTTLVVIAFTATFIYIKLVEKIKLGTLESISRYVNLVITLILLSTLFTVHVAIMGLPVVFSIVDIAVLAAYSVFFYTTYFAFYASKQGFGVKYVFVVLALIFLLLVVFTYTSLIEGVILDFNIALHGLPLALLVVGLYRYRGEEERFAVFVKTLLLLPLTVGILYILTYAKWAVTITHRFLNYFVFLLALSLVVISRIKLRAAVFITLILLINSSIVLHSMSTGRDPVLFYWRYTVADTVLGNYIENYSTTRLVSSVKYSYMLSGEIASVSLDLISILRSCSSTSSVLLITSYEEFIYGLPLSPLHYVRLTTDLFECSSVVYNSLKNYVLVK